MSDGTGFAIRLADGCGLLQKCGNAGKGFVSCCPESSSCTSANDNTYCCPEGEDCTDELDDEPRCADTDWGLYNNHYWDGAPGYFCCAGDLRGYNQTTAFSNGCAKSDESLGDDEDWLPLVDQTIPTSTTSTTATSAPATETADSDSGSTNAGAIAGGVVGGVAGLAIIGVAVWWFLRRRGRGAAQPVEVAEMAEEAKSPAGPPREMDATPRSNQPPSELPA